MSKKIEEKDVLYRLANRLSRGRLEDKMRATMIRNTGKWFGYNDIWVGDMDAACIVDHATVNPRLR